ncbi:MAG: hypothetical protein HY298_08440 [Verrucomicrobia bacterium]|nr:hypothetical protein [Verrucomicrobiota bacterium]
MNPKYLAILAACSLAAVSLQAQDQFTNGLVAYYPFNGNVNDESGFGRNEIIYGDATLTSDRFGVSGRAYAFDGTNDWLRSSSPINDVTNNFTMTIWFRASEVHRTNEFGPCIIFPAHGAATWGDSSVGAGISAGTNQIGVWEHTHNYNPKVMQLDGYFPNWTMVTLVYSNRIPFLYTNGILAAVGNQSSQSPVRPSNGQALTSSLYGNEEGGFGGYHQVGGGGSFFKGSLDDIRIYNRTLSDQEVQQLYNYEVNPIPFLTVAVKTIRLSMFVALGKTNQLESSSNLITWTNYGSPFTATNSVMYQDVDVSNGQRFFRIKEVGP